MNLAPNKGSRITIGLLDTSRNRGVLTKQLLMLLPFKEPFFEYKSCTKNKKATPKGAAIEEAVNKK